MNAWVRCSVASVYALLGMCTALGLTACGAGEETPSAPAPVFTSTLVLGASLTDTGNACAANGAACPPAPPYASGRYSDGALWIETVAAHYGNQATAAALGGHNFAYAGARTGSVQAALEAAGLTAAAQTSAVVAAPTVPAMNAALGGMPSQIDQLLARVGYRIAPHTLVVVDAATFGNNIADALTLSALHPTDAAAISAAVTTAAVADMVAVINRLYAAGASTVLIVNAPNVGATPRVQALGASAIAGATQLANAFNSALTQQVNALRQVMTQTDWVLFDLYALETEIKAGTAAGGFVLANHTDACLLTTPALTVCATPASYFYWDGFHPTAAVGNYVATRVVAALPAS